MIDLTLLNKEQSKAVTHINGPVSVIAGAGSGKTKTLTYRIAYMITEGIDPQSIVAVTFTNKAAAEMKERVMNLVGEKGYLTQISTFHAFCSRFLRNEITNLNQGYTRRFLIIDEDDSKQIIRDTVKELNYDSNKYSSNRLKNLFSKIKNGQYDFLDFDETKIFNAYNQYLKDNNALDFDDLILKTIEVFNRCPEVKDYYNRQYEYILVDEFQDTNKTQYELLKLLIGSNNNIFVVGDPDQSIYSFRGAHYENQNRYMIEFSPKVYVLDQNYRSTTKILDAANRLISYNSGRTVEKNLMSNLGEGLNVVHQIRESDRDEAYFVTKAIEDLVFKGIEYNDIAVLYRANAISRVFEESFLKNNIPYVIYGGLSFFQRKEIKDILAYIRLCLNPMDNISLKRIINVPRRKIGQVTIQKLETYATIYNVSLFDAIDKVDLGKAVKQNLIDFKNLIINLTESISKINYLPDVVDLVGKKSGYYDMLISEGNESKDRLDNINELKAVFYQGTFDYQMPPLEALQLILDDLSLKTDVDFDNSANTVKLATIHQVKGLEFKVVFLVALEEGIFPSEQSFSEFDIEEERRVCYVAMTRAKERLIISHARTRFRYGEIRYNMPSRFISEMDILPDKPVTPVREQPLSPYDFLDNINQTEKEEIIPGDRVKHEKYGFGVVVGLDEDVIKIAFGMEFGIKMFTPGHPSIKKVKKDI